MLYNSSMEKISRISRQVDDYVNSIGNARAAVYRFPALSSRESFSLYLNSVMSALKRAELRPVYSWSYDTTANAYTLLLLVSGYFRSNMDDVTEVINRLWRLYSSGYVTKIADMAVQAETLNQDKIRLWSILQDTAFVSMPVPKVNPFHQRQFACCRVY